jgi:hypothetical protein
MLKGLKRAARLDIVPVAVVRLSRTRIRRNDTLDTSVLRRPTHRVRAQCSSVVHAAGGPPVRPPPRSTGTGHARAFLRQRLLVFAMIGGGAGSSGVAGICIGSTHSSSSRSAESAEIVREKSRMRSPFVRSCVAGHGRRVIRPEASSSMQHPLCPLKSQSLLIVDDCNVIRIEKISESSASSSSRMCPFPSPTPGRVWM